MLKRKSSRVAAAFSKEEARYSAPLLFFTTDYRHELELELELELKPEPEARAS